MYLEINASASETFSEDLLFLLNNFSHKFRFGQDFEFKGFRSKYMHKGTSNFDAGRSKIIYWTLLNSILQAYTGTNTESSKM